MEQRQNPTGGIASIASNTTTRSISSDINRETVSKMLSAPDFETAKSILITAINKAGTEKKGRPLTYAEMRERFG